MNESDFALQIKRVERAMDVSISSGEVDELRQRYIGLDKALFYVMCTHVIDSCRFTPKPANFAEARSAVSQSWRAEISTSSPKCDACRGGFNVVYYFDEMLGRPYQGVVPCKRCNAHQYIPKGYGVRTLEDGRPRFRAITEGEFEAWHEEHKAPTFSMRPPAKVEPQVVNVSEVQGEEPPM